MVGAIRSWYPPINISAAENLRLNEIQEFLPAVLPKICEVETLEASDEITPLSEIKADTYINVLTKIITISEFENCTSKAILLNVSDGLKLSYNSLYQAGKSCMQDNNDLIRAAKTHSCFISVFDEHVDVVKRLIVGDVVFIKNLHVKAVSKELIDQCNEDFHVPQVCLVFQLKIMSKMFTSFNGFSNQSFVRVLESV